MRLEKYQDNRKKRKNIMLITIGAIVLISVSLLLYKTFASFTEEFEFPVINGKVDYFGNSDVYFAFYEGDQELEEMPKKDNEDNLVFSHGECDNGASIVWDNEEWGPLVKNLRNSKTKCSIYFQKRKYLQYGEVNIPITFSGDGLYEVTHEVSEISEEWNKTEYRYAGVNPNNYVFFNNEIWRIIGLVNVKTESGIEQRVKIVRMNGIEGQKDFGTYSYDYKNIGVGSCESKDGSSYWIDSQLKDMLNGIYYNSESGECYRESNVATQCDFTGSSVFPKGLSDVHDMIDTDIIWPLGGTDGEYQDLNNGTVKHWYEKERANKTYKDRSIEWNSKIDIGNKFNGIGLIYPSDYGYATNGGSIGRNTCFSVIFAYGYNGNCWNDENYSTNCAGKDWLKGNGNFWVLSHYTGNSFLPMFITSIGALDNNYARTSRNIYPVVYLKTTVKIVPNLKLDKEYGSLENPFILE